MLTSEAIEKRKAMKMNPRVMKLMRGWWDSAMALSKEIIIPGELYSTGKTKKGKEEQMTKGQYVTVLVALQKMLEPGIAHKEAVEMAEFDWAQDMAHDSNELMAFDHFFGSIFELCDTWVNVGLCVCA
jgi:hypothetical protein